MTLPTLLLVDDSEISRQLTLIYVKKMGLNSIGVEHGLAAVEFCRQHRPDLILMDVNMPVMDGIEATRQLRSLFADDWVPIIFLTGCDSQDEVIQGLRAGGDDYLVKPVNYQLLSAKIQVFLRIARMQKQMARDAIRLAQYYEKNESEQSLALELIQRLTHRSFSGQDHVWHQLTPAENFNGDVICRSRSPGGQEHFLLADCTGHGLTAAISALPVIDGFYERVGQFTSNPQLASDINQKLHSLLPTGRFVAAILCAIDYRKQTLAIWNGGIPCVLLFSATGELKQSFGSRHPALGVLDQADFDNSNEHVTWTTGDMLAICSDGVTEALDPQGRMFGIDGVLSAVRHSPPGETGPGIVRALEHHLQGKPIQDDSSLLVIGLNRESFPEMNTIVPTENG